MLITQSIFVLIFLLTFVSVIVYFRPLVVHILLIFFFVVLFFFLLGYCLPTHDTNYFVKIFFIYTLRCSGTLKSRNETLE